MTKYIFTFGLCIATFLLNNVLAADIQILPNVSEITLKSGADLTLECTGDVPVKWSAGSLDDQDSPVNILNGTTINGRYVSELSLKNASYFDTGIYYCDPISVEKKDEDKNSSNNNIYVNVQDDTHLLAIPWNFVLLEKNEFDDVIIPCRPTSPDLNVILMKDNVELTYNNSIDTEWHYDPKVGFTHKSMRSSGTGTYICYAKSNPQEIHAFYQLEIHPDISYVPKPFINRSDPYLDHIIILGQNVTLNCSVSMDVGVSFKLRWKTPNEQKNKSERIHDNDETFITTSFGSTGSRVLSIQNVTAEDEGQYICQVICKASKTNNNTFPLKLQSNESFLNITLEGKHTYIKKAGTTNVTWVAQVSANPLPKLQWRYLNGTEITDVSNESKESKKKKKIFMENIESFTRLVIKDLELYDSGRYELFADNGKHTQTINVTLLVKDMPIVNITRDSKFNELYEFGKVHIFHCYVAGYPLPKVEWTFKKCPNYPECEESSILIPRSMYKETAIGEIFLSSVVNFTATETGKLLCSASNELGDSYDESVFLVTDLNDPYDLVIRAPSLFVEGDNVTIECGASIYKYLDNIHWIHKTSNTETYINIDEKGNIINNKTSFSYRSYLMIKNITKKHDGEYQCLANKLKTQKKEEKSVSVKVQSSFSPMIHKTTKSSWEVKTGEQVKMECNASGMPPPSVSWFKDHEALHWNKNNRLQFDDNNQKLVIQHTALQDEGSYSCKASNRLGYDELTFNLVLTDKPSIVIYVVICIVLIILLGFLIIAYAIGLKKEKKLKNELAKAGLLHFEIGAIENWNPDLGIEEQAELLPYDRRWEFPKEKLKIGKQLGSGQFGVVFKAEAIGIIDKDTTTTVAVKMVKPNTDPSYIKALASELKIMIHLGKHLNVVNLLGAYTGNINKRELMVIVEYCRFGNLHQYLLKQRDYFVDQVTPNGYLDYNITTISKNPYYENVPNQTNISEKHYESMKIGPDGYLVADELELEWRSNYRGDYNNLIIKPTCTHDLICWSFQVARGMEYLASKKILHGDLATRNILLAEENIVKICDFGFSKTMYYSENYEKKSDEGLLPVKWMAIESLRDRVFSTQSDVWAFGIVLWEIFSLAVTPYPNVRTYDELFNKLVEGYKMEQPKYSNSEIYTIMLDCWKMNPMTRPSFTDLAERLGYLLQDGTKSHYMNLNEVYMRMNSVGSHPTDYLSLLSVSTSLNYSKEFVNDSNSCQNVSKKSVNKEDLELKQMINHNHNNSAEHPSYINLTKPHLFSNPSYDVLDYFKNHSCIQSPSPSNV